MLLQKSLQHGEVLIACFQNNKSISKKNTAFQRNSVLRFPLRDETLEQFTARSLVEINDNLQLRLFENWWIFFGHERSGYTP